MKIRIEISEETDEEIVIRCKRENARIRELENILGTMLRGSSELVLHVDNTEYYVPVKEILFFETQAGRVYAHTSDRMYRSDLRLFELEATMPYWFTRISKAAVANVKEIESLRRELTGNGEISFRGCDKTVYFSRAYYHQLKDKIEEVRCLK